MSSRRNNGGPPVAAERGRGAIENGAGRFYQLDAERLAYWTDGTWMHGTPAVLRGIAHDTRALRPGELYLALIGDRYDGHDFIEEAIRRGAVGAVVARGRVSRLPREWPLLGVRDTREALNDIARGHRRMMTGRIVGVSGSVGKTTVKEMLADVLGVLGPVARTPENWNNDIGLPLSLIRMRPDDRWGVFEVGMNHPGEMKTLCGLMKPDWAVLTTIGPVHMGFFNSVEEIVAEKAELFRALREDGLAFVSSDQTAFAELAAAAPCRVVRVSTGGDQAADYLLERGAATDGEMVVRERKTGASFRYIPPLPGEHMLENTLLAIAVGREAGVAPEPLADALRAYRPPPMRWQVILHGGVRYINDAYNANPVSMRAALRTFAAVGVHGRRWLVLGGMWELGRFERREHLALGREVAKGEWAGLIVVGELGALIAEGAREAGWPAERIIVAAGVEDAAAELQARTGAGDAVLLKASRGERLERVLEAIRQQAAD